MQPETIKRLVSQKQGKEVRRLYTDLDSYCCAVLRARVADGGLPPGEVWERDIKTLTAAELATIKAKQENDERYMTERDEARRQLSDATTKLANVKRAMGGGE